jgi:hypothetical protein
MANSVEVVLRSRGRLLSVAKPQAQKPPLVEPAFMGLEHTAKEVLAMRTNSRLAAIAFVNADRLAALGTIDDMLGLFGETPFNCPARWTDCDFALRVAGHQSLVAAGKACVEIGRLGCRLTR